MAHHSESGNHRRSFRPVVRDVMGYPRSDYSRYDPYGEEKPYEDRSRHGLEGAGRKGWDYDQNRAYGAVYGNYRGSSESARNFTGRGPKNYRRPDERILEDIHRRLEEDSYVDATDIDVVVENGEVVMTGVVVDKGAKRRAEDLAESISGVKNVENRIRIQKR